MTRRVERAATAATGIPVMVALEIARAAGRRLPSTSSVDCEDGGRQSDLGRRTDRRRTPRQAWHSSVSADGAPVHPVSTTTRETRNPGVEHLRAKTRTVGARQRFLCSRDSQVPRDLRLCRSGYRDTTNLHWNVTEDPTAQWTAQQFRMIVPGDVAICSVACSAMKTTTRQIKAVDRMIGRS